MKRKLLFAVFTSGFASTVIQLILMRELVTLFYGNELVFGITLSIWIISVAAGSYFTGIVIDRVKLGSRYFGASQLALVFSFPFILFFCRISKDLLGIPFGSVAGLTQVMLVTLLSVIVPALIFGFQFAYATKLLVKYKEESDSVPGTVYAWESFGSFIGGILFSFIFSVFLAPFQIFAVAGSLLAVSAFFLSLRAVSAAALVFCLCFAASGLPETASLSRQWGFEVAGTGNSPYGTLVAIKDGDNTSFYQNGDILFSTADRPFAEELATVNFLEAPKAKKILILGSAGSNLIDEVMKYGPEKVVVVDTDPNIESFSRKLLKGVEAYAGGKVETASSDPAAYVRHEQGKFDLIILNMPEPHNGSLNRYYTKEFFSDCAMLLEIGGVFSFRMTASETYMGKESSELNSILYKTVSAVFTHTGVLNGTNNYFFASFDDVLAKNRVEMEKRWSRLKPRNRYFDKGVFDSFFLPLRQEDVLARIKPGPGTRINRDMDPAAYYYSSLLWLSRTGSLGRGFMESFSAAGMPAVLCSVILLLVVLRMALRSERGKAMVVMFIAGSCGMAMQIAMMLVFQSYYGSLYGQIGLLTACFMAGLAAGSKWTNNMISYVTKISVRQFILMFTFFSGLIYAVFLLGDVIPILFFYLISFVLALYVGILFTAVVKVGSAGEGDNSSAAASMYAMDLLGGCASALLVSVLLIPVWGVLNTILFVIILSILSILFCF